MLGLGLGLQLNSYPLFVLDPATIAFITAAGITDPTQINAINRLVLNYKGQGNLNSSVNLWTGTSAIYPIVGGSANSHKYNLKDPQDTNAAFRLSFSGGWTHSSNGALPNGINAYADTFITPVFLTQNNVRALYYSRTNNTGSTSMIEIGTTSPDFQLSIRWDGTLGNLSRINNAFVASGYIPTKTSGLFAVNRSASNSTKVFEDGVLKQTKTDASSAPTSNSIYIAARNNGLGGIFFTNRQLAFSVFGNSLSDANSLIEYNIIQQFQTDLNRNV